MSHHRIPFTSVSSPLKSGSLSAALPLAVALVLGGAHRPAIACGGFFCELTPIDQAGEQIVFRQDGDTVTALVRILYTGAAESFSWVVPVPDDPDLDVGLGDDLAFMDLDLATRPQFNLRRTGNSCDDFGSTGGDDGFSSPTAEADSEGGGVSIEREFTVGGFDVQILASNDGNPEAMATWLVDNGYDLTENGRALLAPYIADGMKFVALKLRSGASSGSIQPLAMTYKTDKPMIPIRLTGVAATPDMGVLTWIVGDARAVPENYLHVTPNYARLNWYTGSQNAYVSYQSLITDAMNEVSQGGDNDAGQGFATDFAGRISSEIRDGLSPSELRLQDIVAELAGLDTLSDQPAAFIARALSEGDALGSPRLLTLRSDLPVPEGRDESIYLSATQLRENFTAEQLATARDNLREAIVTTELDALHNTLALFPVNAYMTRLYTTLSADEMSVDPVFAYNPDMDTQALVREATLDQRCGDNGTEWTLTLGSGTGRDGETVIRANQPIPFSVPSAANTQEAAFLQERTAADASPSLVARANLNVLDIASDGSVSDTPVTTSSRRSNNDNGFLGASGASFLALLGLFGWLRHLSVKRNNRNERDRPDRNSMS